MKRDELLSERLHRQHLTGATLPDATAVVRWQGAVQAQEFAGALWAIGQRIAPGSGEADVLAAFDAGALIRTHVLRPTWHLVAPEDLRWMLALTGPRLHTSNASRYRDLGLDAPVRARAARTFARALEGGQHLTRHDLAAALRRARIDPGDQRLVHLLFHAELEGLICSGPRVGTQPTYALVDERVPPAPPRDREDALATLTTRYFSSHGPATVRDAAWWSGLSMGAVREGIALAGDALERRVIGDAEHWAGSGALTLAPAGRGGSRTARVAPMMHLLPSYDEYTVAYRDRTALLHASTPSSTVAQSALLLQPVLLDGRHIGSWRRAVPTRAGASIVVDVRLLSPLAPRQRQALVRAGEQYGAFLGRPVTLRGDGLDERDRTALHGALKASDSDVAVGRLVDTADVLRGLRTR